MPLPAELEALVAQGRTILAERALRKLLAADPNDPDALRALGMILCETGHHDEGQAVLYRFLDLSPVDWQAHFRLAKSLLLYKRNEKAVAHLEAARRQASPPRLEVISELARCYLILNRGDAALHEFAQIDPLLPDAV